MSRKRVQFSVHPGRWTAAIVVTGVLLYPSVRAAAFPRDYAIFPLGIRSAAMGETGTADRFEVPNTAYNPALASTMKNVQAAWGLSDISFWGLEVRLNGGVVGGGYQWRLSRSLSVGGGLLFSYAKESLGTKYDYTGEPLDETRWGPFDQAYIFGAGAAAGYNDIVQMGFGFQAKKYKWDNVGGSRRQVLQGVIYDAGVYLGVVVLKKNGYELSAAGGFAYFNFGGQLDQEITGIFLPDDSLDPPEYRRYGVNVVFESPSWREADRVFAAKLAAVSVSFNYDIVDRAYADVGVENRYMMGGELAFLKILSLRLGHIRQDNSDYYLEDTDDETYGLGLAVPYRRYSLRFDYARRNFTRYDAHENDYGLVFDAAF